MIGRPYRAALHVVSVIMKITDVRQHARQKPVQGVLHNTSIQRRPLIICAFISKSKTPA